MPDFAHDFTGRNDIKALRPPLRSSGRFSPPKPSVAGSRATSLTGRRSGRAPFPSRFRGFSGCCTEFSGRGGERNLPGRSLSSTPSCLEARRSGRLQEPAPRSVEWRRIHQRRVARQAGGEGRGLLRASRHCVERTAGSPHALNAVRLVKQRSAIRRKEPGQRSFRSFAPPYQMLRFLGSLVSRLRRLPSDPRSPNSIRGVEGALMRSRAAKRTRIVSSEEAQPSGIRETSGRREVRYRGTLPSRPATRGFVPETVQLCRPSWSPRYGSREPTPYLRERGRGKSPQPLWQVCSSGRASQFSGWLPEPWKPSPKAPGGGSPL